MVRDTHGCEDAWSTDRTFPYGGHGCPQLRMALSSRLVMSLVLLRALVLVFCPKLV